MGTGFSTACHAANKADNSEISRFAEFPLGFPSNVQSVKTKCKKRIKNLWKHQQEDRRLHVWAQSLPDLQFNNLGVVLSYLGPVMKMLLSALSITFKALILHELHEKCHFALFHVILRHLKSYHLISKFRRQNLVWSPHEPSPSLHTFLWASHQGNGLHLWHLHHSFFSQWHWHLYNLNHEIPPKK